MNSNPIIIRAPLTSEDTSSGGEVELQSGSGSEPASDSEPDAESMPVARLTGDEDSDDDVDDSEESFEEVDGDGFVVRVRIPVDERTDSNPNPTSYVARVSSLDGSPGPNRNLSLVEEGEAEHSSNDETEESFDEVDGDGFVIRVRNADSNPNPSSVGNPSSDANSSLVDEVDGDGFIKSVPPVNANANANFIPSSDGAVEREGFAVDEVSGQNRNLNGNADSKPDASSVDGREGEDSSTDETEENFDEVDGDGFVVEASAFVNENSGSNLNPSSKEGVSRQDHNLEGNYNAEEYSEDFGVVDFDGGVISNIDKGFSRNGSPGSNPRHPSLDDEGERENSDVQNPNSDENLTAGEYFEESEVFDRDRLARVSSQDGSSIYNPNSSSVDGGESEDGFSRQNPNLDENSSGAEYFDDSEIEVSDGDMVFNVARLFPNPSLDDDDEDNADEGGGGNLKDDAKSEIFKEALGADLNLDEAVKLEAGNVTDEDSEDLDVLREEANILGSGSSEMSFVVEDDDLKPRKVNFDEIEKDRVGHDSNHGEVQVNAVEAKQIANASITGKDRVVGENCIVEGNAKRDGGVSRDSFGENPVKDGAPSGNCNLLENSRMNGAHEYGFGDYLGRIEEENGDADTLDEKYKSLGSGPEPMKVLSDTIEKEMDQVGGTCKHEELQSIAADTREADNVVSDSNQNLELKNEDCSVSVDSGKFENSARGVEGGDDDKGRRRANLGPDSLVESGIAEYLSDDPVADNEGRLFLIEDEKAVIKMENASVELKAELNDSKLGSVANSDLFESNYKATTGGQDIKKSCVAEGKEEGGKVSDAAEEKEFLDYVSLLEINRALAFSTNSNYTMTASDSARILPVDDPVDLGTSVSPLNPAQLRESQRDHITSHDLRSTDKPDKTMTEEENLHEKVESIRVKFLRISHRMGHSSKDNITASVLYRLALIENVKYWKRNIRNAGKKAIELEREEKDELDFSCNVLIIGKAGVGKSATINSMFEEEKSLTNPFETETTSVRIIEGVVNGIKIRVLDTPGLGSSLLDQALNRKVLSSVKKYMKKCPPDVILYVDRLDNLTQDSNDLPLLSSIANTLDPSIWSNMIIILTHAAEAPPEGPSGMSLSYEEYVNLRSDVIRQSIRHAAGDLSLTNLVVLVENHPSWRRNKDGQKLIPNGSRWRSELLLLCFSLKILSEVNPLPKVKASFMQKLCRFRSLPLQFFLLPTQFFLSSVLQSKAHPKLDNSDVGFNIFSDVEDEEDEYDQLPQFHPLTKSQIAKLTEEQKKTYFDEYEYRVKLLQKKQLKQEIRQLKEIKAIQSNCDIPEDFDDMPTAMQSPGPDMELSPSFDCDNRVYRYQFLEQPSQWCAGLLVGTHGWDHDRGIDRVSLQKLLAIAKQFPAEAFLRLRKGKNDFSINSVSAKHGDGGYFLLKSDAQTIGNEICETEFGNLKKKKIKTALAATATFLEVVLASGLKLDYGRLVGKRVMLAAGMGVVPVGEDVAYRANLEATLMKKDYHDPISQPIATLGLTLFRYYESSDTNMIVHVGLNNRKTGKITIRASGSNQLQMMLMGLVSIMVSVMRMKLAW